MLLALLGRLCHFPAAGEEVPTWLVVPREGSGQCGERTVGAHALATAPSGVKP